MFELNGKCALVTGATGGIGSEIARRFAEAGAKVAVSGTRIDRLEALAAEIGANAVPLPCDLSDAESVRALPGRAAEAAGPIGILVNNAGITRDNLLLRISDEDWRQVLEVNLNAAMMLCRGVLRGMMKARWGRIINVTSVVGATGNPGQANYSAAKAALTAFGKSLAAEVANRGITVNSLAPGFIETEMTAKLSEEQRGRILGQVPARRMGEPQDIAAAALYLASEEAGYVTGQSLHVNGGLAML